MERRSQLTKGEATKRRILEAAIHEFGSYGLYSATMESVARRARVQKSLIFHYYRNKFEILEDAIRDVLSQFADILSRWDMAASDALTNLNRYFEANVVLAKSYPTSVNLMLVLYSTATHEKALRKTYDEILTEARKRYSNVLLQGIRERQFPANLAVSCSAQLLHAWIVGAMVDFAQNPMDAQREKALRESWVLLTRSILKI